MKIFQITLGGMNTQANTVKEVLISALVKEGILDQRTADKFNQNYAVIVTEKGMLGKAFDAVLFRNKAPEENIVFTCVKKID